MPPWKYSVPNPIVDILRNQLQKIGLAPIKTTHHWMIFQPLPQGQRTLVTFRRRPHVLSQTRPYIDLQLGARSLVDQSSITVYILIWIHFYIVSCYYAAATLQMSPVKNRATGKPLLVEPVVRVSIPSASIATLGSKWVCFFQSRYSYGSHDSGCSTYPILPHALATDIQHFSESEYAKQYFSTHRTGFIFRRRVPVAQLMTWQKVRCRIKGYIRNH